MFAVRASASASLASAALTRRANVGAKKFNPLACHVARKSTKAKIGMTVVANSGEKDPNAPYDIYRDSPLRYMGYANEVGEAFAAFVGETGVVASYGVAGASPLASSVARLILKIYPRTDSVGSFGNRETSPPSRLADARSPPAASSQRSTCSRTP